MGLSARLASPIAMAVVAVFTTLLLRGTKLGDLAQRVTSLAKTLALLVLVGACFIFGGQGARRPAVGDAPRRQPTSGFAAFLLAAQSVIYTYDGWTGPLYFSEELDDPARQIPRSMFYGLADVAAIYLLINIAFVYAVPTAALRRIAARRRHRRARDLRRRGESLVRVVVVA